MAQAVRINAEQFQGEKQGIGMGLQIVKAGLAALVLSGLGASVLAQSTPPPSREAGLLGRALTAAEAADWATARTMAAQAGPIAERLVLWAALRAGEGDLAARRRFLDAHPDWPLTNPIQRHAEADLATAAAADVLGFFANRSPITEEGHLALLTARLGANQFDAALAQARALWRETSLSAQAEAQIEAVLGAQLRDLDQARVNMLLWAGETQAASRHLDRLPAGPRAVARARIALQERANGVDALVAAVPASLAQDPGLVRDRFEYRMRAGNHAGAGDLLIAQSRSSEGLGNAEAWAQRRIFLVRQARGEGAYQRAYDLATPHGLSDGAQLVDLEFLAGFIALVHLNQPERALGHFRALRVRVSSPISLGRAGYWEGRAHEALGDAISAQAAYEFAAEHQSAYYGQLAADRLGLALDHAIGSERRYPDWRTTPLAKSDQLAAALALRDAGRWIDARRFVLSLARGITDEDQFGALGDLFLSINEPNWALNVAKIAIQAEILLPDAYFPVTDLARGRFDVPMDLVKAIARRESEFDPAVVSSADARGLMQVLPGTAQMMARRLGVPFDAASLTRDADMNARFGAAYLAELRDEFGPSLALVAAGYNAGPGRPRQWIQTLGDPRDPAVDIVTWVESVPFAETRNYIMRVAESQVVYRARLAGAPQRPEVERLLRGR